jgi:hypothetical protein
MQVLDLHSTRLSGTIPAALASWNQLALIDLSG